MVKSNSNLFDGKLLEAIMALGEQLQIDYPSSSSLFAIRQYTRAVMSTFAVMESK